MRRIISLSMGVAFAVTAFAALPASAEPAVVVRGDVCGLPGVTAEGDLGGVYMGTTSNAVRNKNNAKVTCKGESANDAGRTLHFSGFGCLVSPLDGSDYILTYDSHATITKKGKATLTCRTTLPGA